MNSWLCFVIWCVPYCQLMYWLFVIYSNKKSRIKCTLIPWLEIFDEDIENIRNYRNSFWQYRDTQSWFDASYSCCWATFSACINMPWYLSINADRNHTMNWHQKDRVSYKNCFEAKYFYMYAKYNSQIEGIVNKIC